MRPPVDVAERRVLAGPGGDLVVAAKTVAKLAGWMPVSMSYWLAMMPETSPCSPGIGQIDEALHLRQLGDACRHAPPVVGAVENLLLWSEAIDDPPGAGRHRPALVDVEEGEGGEVLILEDVLRHDVDADVELVGDRSRRTAARAP